MVWTNKRNNEWVERAQNVIPNGMYGHESVRLMPEGTPQFFSRSAGTRLWDVDGNEYIDYMCAYGPNLMGYGHPDIQAAIVAQQALGDTMTGPSTVMVELAETFVSMVKNADWALFCKNGTDATTTAMVTARAYRGKRKILVARNAYHGSAPWTVPNLTGILPEDRAHIIAFEANDLDSLKKAVKLAGDDVAGIFSAPFKHDIFHDQTLVEAEYAKGVREICDSLDALLVVDEVRSGFRLARGAAWETVGVEPDLVTFGKGIGNGQPISALVGSKKARAAVSSIMVTGSFWFSAVPMAASLATLKLVRETQYLEHTVKIGTLLRSGLDKQSKEFGFSLRQSGPVQMPLVLFDDDPDYRKSYRWGQTAMRHGVYLSPYHNMFINAAMTEKDVETTLEATGLAFEDLKANRSTIEPPSSLSLIRRVAA